MKKKLCVFGVKLSLALTVGVCVLSTTSLQAQQYSCKNSSGRYVPSYSPCAGPSGGGLVYYPPVDPSSGSGASYNQSQRFQQQLPRAQDPEAYVQYMSARCAGMNDALRTASSRGISYEKINAMRRDYSKSCQEDESDAREQMSKAYGEKRQEKLDAKKSEKLSEERAALKIQQCGESKRILVTKKARGDLNDGEKAELQRFEDNYRARCS